MIIVSFVFFFLTGAKLALVGRKPERFEAFVTKIKASGVKAQPLVILADISVDYMGV